MSDAGMSARRLDNLATMIRIGAWLALLTVAIFLALAPLYRFGIISVDVLFIALRNVLTPALLLLGGISAVFALVAFVTGRAKAGILALIAGGAALGSGYVPVSMKQKAEAVPMIHDITTNSLYPPQFVAIAPLRENAPNPISYNEEDGEKQRAAYDGLETLFLPDYEFEEVFEASVATLTKMGLDIVESEENAGRIEAIATSMWYGFKDDVSVSVNRFSEIVEVDIRSKSRVGKSDLGTNADRIRVFLAQLQDALPKKTPALSGGAEDAEAASAAGDDAASKITGGSVENVADGEGDNASESDNTEAAASDADTADSN